MLEDPMRSQYLRWHSEHDLFGSVLGVFLLVARAQNARLYELLCSGSLALQVDKTLGGRTLCNEKASR